ncbi:glycosyltransferase family 2 protein [Usitatibacter palustris]|uniref:Undecaprenyl-phosphate 4-deoxy-4-formamido-L-arabinose transferase n=1 Tax=Usitatibacter palustris TaxID=2732487 RepID=A0A6M4HA35_9PROT|nr:glycosyltransferase family 2 protein [Usitatibacter palustris]QJR15728.1 Undecaprenyl-phosphate 4-deoxy-4-formamido-L-arabinose transferase [Usitatibacter palustris]
MKAAVIPALGEAATIRDIAQRTRAWVDLVVIVDDGSSDGTAARLEGLDVVVLRHESRRGKAAALWTGFAHALACGADAIVTIDGDGQHGPEDIPRLLAAHARFPDRIVIGSRLHDRANFPARRYYANCFARFWISWAAGYPIADTQTGFRVYPAALLAALDRDDFHGDGFVFESEVLIRAAKMGIHAIAVPIPGIYPKAARASHFRPVADIARIVIMVGGYLFRPGMFAKLRRSLGRAEIIEQDPARG